MKEKTLTSHESADKLKNETGNIIKKLNIIKDGINFIVPSFWYQELIDLNKNSRTIEEIRFPPYQFMVKFLRLHALQNPSESPFQIKQQFSAFSTNFLVDLLQQNNFNVSKTLKFSKLNDVRQCSEIQWSLLNPYLWNLIENRIQIMLLDKQSVNQLKPQDEIIQSQQLSFEQLPRLIVIIKKEFILQKGQSRANQRIKNNTNDIQSIEINYKNRKYLIKRQQLQRQISIQLKSLSPQQTNLLIISDETKWSNLQLTKLSVCGFFPQSMGFKELVKNLIRLQSANGYEQVNDKFYIYDQWGHKITSKITTVQILHKLSSQKQIIISTLSIQSISERKIGLRNSLNSLLSSIGNDDNNWINNEGQNYNQDGQQQSRNLRRVNKFLQKRAKQIEYKRLKHAMDKLTKQTTQQLQQSQQQLPQIPQARSGFKLFNKQSSSQIHIKIQTSQIININNNNIMMSTQHITNEQQNQDDFRLMQSLTTNMDTPPVQQQHQQQQQQNYQYQSNSNYQNKRLHRRHSNTYSRQQRKKKSQSYLLKKKRNNVILLKDNSTNYNKNNKYKGENKKRVKHNLFHSLASLDSKSDNNVLIFLLKNMRLVAKQIACSNESELIAHPYMREMRVENNNEQIDSINCDSNTKQDCNNNNKRSEQNNINQQKINNISSNQNNMIIKQTMLASLQQISSMLQQKHNKQKHHSQQQQQQLQKIQLYQQYNNQQQMMKKDNEQIKTIIDNSQGPCSWAIEKQSNNNNSKQNNHNNKYSRMSEKKLQKNINNQMDLQIEANSMTDGGVNYMEENQETL